jgi:high-affinity Fe2+/Pb2+ permease
MMREVEVMNQSAFTWSVVIAGALASWAVAFLISMLGAGIGLAVASP